MISLSPRLRLLAIVAATLLSACGGSGGTNPPVVLIVTNLDDDGPGSLRGVLAVVALAPPTGDVVVRFASNLAGGTIDLLSEIQPGIAVTIDGDGPSGVPSERITISGGNAVRHFMSSHPLELRNLVLRDGFSAVHGGSIRNFGTLVLDRVLVHGCDAAQGGAILLESGSDATILRSAFTDCHGTEGGAITAVVSELLVRESSFTFNSASGAGGGAIFLRSSDTTLINCTVHGNTASDAVDAQAAAIFSEIPAVVGASNALRLLHCTITGNSSAAGTGPAVNVLPSPFHLTTITVRGTIIAENTGPANGDFDYHSGDGTLSVSISDSILGVANGSTITWAGVNNNLVGTLIVPADPMLGVLTPLFGPGDGRVHRFAQAGSPALDRVTLGAIIWNGAVVSVDQRDRVRGADNLTDAGATDVESP